MIKNRSGIADLMSLIPFEDKGAYLAFLEKLKNANIYNLDVETTPLNPTQIRAEDIVRKSA